jgi:hypothetical protein
VNELLLLLGMQMQQLFLPQKRLVRQQLPRTLL